MKWKIIIPVVFLMLGISAIILFSNKDLKIDSNYNEAIESQFTSQALVNLGNNVYTLTTIDSNVSNWTIDVSDLNNIGLRIDPWGEADDFMISYHDWGRPTGYSVTNDSIVGDFRQGKLIKLENRNYDKEPNMNSTFEGLKVTLVVPDKQVPSAVDGKVKFNFPVTSGFENYNYYLQPPLTQEEIENGNIREDYVIDSIAVYHKNKGGSLVLENESHYGIGKAFHIYRPFVRDSLGNFNWGSWEIDNTTGTLIKVFDESVFQTGADFYNVDGDFGYTSVGASNFAIYSTRSYALQTTQPSSSGTVTKVTASLTYFQLSSGCVAKGAVYDSTSLLEQTSETASDQNNGGTPTWWDFTFSTGPSITASTDYWLGIFGTDNNPSLYAYMKYDSDSNVNYQDTSVNYDTDPNFPTSKPTSTTTSGTMSIYATYTESGGADTTKPTYSNINHNNSIAGGSTNFSISFNDDTSLNPLGQYIFSTNNTGSWVNDSAVNFTATPSNVYVIKTLNSTQGISVGYRWYVTDNATNLNYTSIQTITTTGADTCTYSSGNWDVDCSDNCVISSPVNVNGNISIIGSGVFNIQDNITMTSSNQFVYVGSGCEVRIESGGGFK